MIRGPLPRWVEVVTVVAVALVALVAAVASYVHMLVLAERAGEHWRAYLTPLSVDGLLVAASMVMYVRRRAGLSAGLLPWAGMVAGIAASLGANVAAGHPEWDSPWLAGAISAWPPIALAVAFELLILVQRDRSPAETGEQPVMRDEQPGPLNASDGEVLADLRKITGKLPAGLALRERYGMGSARAARLLEEAARERSGQHLHAVNSAPG